jgi:hypothetical protein
LDPLGPCRTGHEENGELARRVISQIAVDPGISTNNNHERLGTSQPSYSHSSNLNIDVAVSF